MWYDTTTQKIYITHSEIRAARPNISFPAVMSDSDITGIPNIHAILPTAQPEFDPIFASIEQTTPDKIGQEYHQKWVVTPFSTEQVMKNIVVAVQKRLDDFAQTRNYDTILSATTYASSTVPKFQSEGQACVNLRDATWAALYTLLAEVQAETTPMPTTFAEIEAELPALTWPV